MLDWYDRFHAVRKDFAPWIEDVRPLSGATVLEFGCGRGAVACALSPLVKQVVGFDIEGEEIEIARAKADEFGLTNIDFRVRPSYESYALFDEFTRSPVDVVMLYAVLEHMTLDERLEVLTRAQQILTPGGIIVVCETPNRLLWNDFHSTQMPFNFQLPPDLALRLAPRAPRAWFAEQMQTALDAGPARAEEALTRLGRGVSFHEFELALGGLGRIVASNYDPRLLPHRHVHRDELYLARFMEQHAPQLPAPMPPCFSRYYIDCIIVPEGSPVRSRHIRPWIPETVSSQDVGITQHETLYFKSDRAVLSVHLPEATSRVVVGVEPCAMRPLVAVTIPDQRRVEREAYFAKPPRTQYLDFPLPAPAKSVYIQTQAHVHVSFVGYESSR